MSACCTILASDVQILYNKKLVRGANIPNLTKNYLSEFNFTEQFHNTLTQMGGGADFNPNLIIPRFSN